jgi:hypothetical protein
MHVDKLLQQETFTIGQIAGMQDIEPSYNQRWGGRVGFTALRKRRLGPRVEPSETHLRKHVGSLGESSPGWDDIDHYKGE